jgi:hypothetical protein
MADFPTAAQSAVLAANSAKAAANSASISAANAQKATVAAHGGVRSIVQGTNVTVNNSDPLNPIVSASGVVQTIVPGTNVTVDNTDPANPIVSASGGGGGDAVKLIGVAATDIVAPFFAVMASGNGDGTWVSPADPTSATAVHGIATGPVTAGNPVTIVTSGLLRNVLTGASPNDIIYLGDGGAVTNGTPTDDFSVLIKLGEAINSTDMMVNIEYLGYSNGGHKAPVTTQQNGKLSTNVLPVATTSTANKIPLANGSGKINVNWLTGVVLGVQPGTNTTVDNTDPTHPIVNASIPIGAGIISYATLADAKADVDTTIPDGTIAYIANKNSCYVKMSISTNNQFDPQVVVYVNSNITPFSWVRTDKQDLLYRLNTNFYIGDYDQNGSTNENSGLNIGAPTNGIHGFLERFGDLPRNVEDENLADFQPGRDGISDGGGKHIHFTGTTNTMGPVEVKGGGCLALMQDGIFLDPGTLVRITDTGVVAAQADSTNNSKALLGFVLNSGDSSSDKQGVFVKTSGLTNFLAAGDSDFSSSHVGDPVYLSDTEAGTLTQAAPGIPVIVGYISTIQNFGNGTRIRINIRLP